MPTPPRHAAPAAALTAPEFAAYRRRGRLILFLLVLAGLTALVLGVWVFLLNPVDSSALTPALAVLTLPVVTILVRQVRRARAQVFFAPITETQFSDLHARVVEISQQMGVSPTPPAYLIADPSVNPCTEDFGVRPAVLIGTDFFAGCRENDAPEALDFMIAHQLAHIKAGHGTHRWSMAISSVRLIPVLNTFVARHLEFHADAIAARTCPDGAAGALGLCMVSKDNFPYLDPAVQVRTESEGRGLWSTVARWSVSTVSGAERLHRLVTSGAVHLPRHN